MKGATTIQERLWELRKDKGLNLEELSQKTGISKSALASYESDDNKEINHGSLIALADFYEVSIDYLFCRTENREQINTPLSELHLTDEAVELLKSGRINNRLLCEIVTNDKFEQLMTDTEIYIDGHAKTSLYGSGKLCSSLCIPNACSLCPNKISMELVSTISFSTELRSIFLFLCFSYKKNECFAIWHSQVVILQSPRKFS